MTSRTLPIARPHPIWAAVQWAGLLTVVVLVAALVQWPGRTLDLFWNVVVPLLPALFLINPMLWRNVCPLATLNTLSGERIGTRTLRGRGLTSTWVGGMALLGLMVPARRFVFNLDGPVLAVTIALVGALAFALGLVFARRAGFCNGLCPVLPVEKLYGQAPMVGVGSSRCGDCSHCAPLACVDLAGGASALVSLGPGRRSNRWVLTPFGSFAAAFPGFVLGYFTTANGPAATAPAIYGHVALWSAVSWAVVCATAATLRLGSTRLLPSLGALAAGEYYWFAAASMANTMGLGPSGAVGIRLLSLSLVAWWWVTAWRRDPAV